MDAFLINKEMKPEVKFNPGTTNLDLFQIYGSVDQYKILPGPFYRLLCLVHLILLFPTTVLFDKAAFVAAAAVLFQENVALHRTKMVAHLTQPGP